MLSRRTVVGLAGGRRPSWVAGLLALLLVLAGLGSAPPASAATADGGTLTSGQTVTATFAAAFDGVSYQVQVPAGQTVALTASTSGAAVQALVDAVDSAGSPTFTSTSLISNAVGDTGFVRVGVAGAALETLTITLTGVDAGSLTLTAWLVGLPTARPIALDTPTAAVVDVPGQPVAFSVGGPSGTFGLRLTVPQFSDPLLPSNGGDPFTWTFTDANGLPPRITTLAPGVLRAQFSSSGPFVLTVSGVGASTGSVTVEVTRVQDTLLAPTLGVAQTVAVPTVWSAPRVGGFPVPVGDRVRVDVVDSSLRRADGSRGSARISIGGLDVGALTTTPSTFGLERTFGTTVSSSVQVVADGMSTGDVTLVISLVPPDEPRSLVIGQPTTVALPNAFQNATYGLSIAAGDRFEVRVTGNTMTQAVWIGLGAPSPFGFANPLSVVPAGADGWAELSAAAYTGFATGTQSLFVDPVGAGTGSLTLTVRRLSDVGVALPLGAEVTATATSGDRLFFDFPGGATTSRPVLVIDSTGLQQLPGLAVVPETVTDPNSPAVTPVPGFGATVEQNGVKVVSLPLHGPRVTYQALETTSEFDPSRPWRLLVDLTASSAGPVTVRLIKPVVTTVAVRSGTPTSVRVAGPGDSTRLTFRPATGQRIVAETTGATTALQLSLVTTTGTELAMAPAADYTELASASTADPVVLVVRAQDPGATGTARVTVRLVSDPVTTLSGVRTVRWTTGQNPRMTFSAAAGQQPILDVSAAAWSGGQPVGAALLGPDGSWLGSFPDLQPGRATFAEFPFPLAVRGRYTVVLDPLGAAAGSITVRLRWQEQVNRSVALGVRTTVGVDTPGTNVALTVTVPDGVQVRWLAAGSTFAAATLRLQDATGVEYAGAPLPRGDSSGVLPGFALGAGTYRVVVDPSGSSTGSVRLTLTGAPA